MPRAEESILPIHLTRFFGREAELSALNAHLASGQARLLTLTGPGGIGKTRLALEAVRRLLDNDAAAAAGIRCFVSLADITDFRLAADAVRRALGLPPPGPGLAPRDQITDALRAAPCALLIWDNAEHLLDAFLDSADSLPTLVNDLLARVPGLTCLVTSRRPLGLPGERELPLAPLPFPEDEAGDSNDLTPAVALFMDRATAARPDFLLTARNGRAIAELCRQLDGLPLSLELAAARVGTLSVAQMLGQIGERLDLLTRRGPGGGTARHRSLRAAVQWSYDLLTPELQTAFARLAVFRGGWDANAAATVWEVSRTRAYDLLADLRAHSLIVAQEAGEQMRYRMLETLRAFADELLIGEERVQASRRHAEYYYAQAEAVRRAMEQPDLPRQELLRMDRAMEAEYDNVRAALAFGQAGTNADQQQGLRLAVAMTPRWYWRGHLVEGPQWLEALLEASQAAAVLPLPTPLEGAARQSLGLFYRIIGHARPARRELEQAVELLDAYPDDEYLPWAHHVLAISLLDAGEYAEMEHHNRTADSIWTRRGHAHGVALSRYNDALGHYRRGDTRQAETAVTQAASLCRACGADLYLGLCLGLLGCILDTQARHEEAIARYQEALAFFREQGIAQFVAITRRDEGVAHLGRGDYDAALACGTEAEQVFQQTGGHYGASTARLWNAQAYLYRNAPGDTARGEALLARVEADAASGIGTNLPIYAALMRAAVVLRTDTVAAHDQVRATITALRTLLGCFLAQDERANAAFCLEHLSDAHQRLGDPDRAARLLQAADMLRVALGSPPAQRDRQWLDPLRCSLPALSLLSFPASWETIARQEAEAASAVC